MARTETKTPLQRVLLARMAERGMSMRELSLAAGKSEGLIKHIMQGRSVSPRWDSLTRIAKALGFPSVNAMMDGVADGAVPLIGSCGAGEQIIPFGPDYSFESIEVPPGLHRGAAVVVRGDSMLPVYRDGDVLVFERPPPEHDGEVRPEAIKRDCVIELADGRMYVKVLQPGTAPRRYHLLSYNRPDVIADAEVRWAAPVLWVKRG